MGAKPPQSQYNYPDPSRSLRRQSPESLQGPLDPVFGTDGTMLNLPFSSLALGAIFSYVISDQKNARHTKDYKCLINITQKHPL